MRSYKCPWSSNAVPWFPPISQMIIDWSKLPENRSLLSGSHAKARTLPEKKLGETCYFKAVSDSILTYCLMWVLLILSTANWNSCVSLKWLSLSEYNIKSSQGQYRDMPDPATLASCLVRRLNYCNIIALEWYFMANPFE